MKTKLLVMLAVAMLAGPVQAADPQPEKAQLEEAERSLEDARRRLEEAAREVAELSMEAGGDMEIIRHIRSSGRRAMLGINIGPGEGGAGKGVKVLGVTPGGPADQAGLKTGDVITRIGDTSLAADSARESQRLLLQFMRDMEPGSDVKLVYQRDDGKIENEIQLRTKAADTMAFGFAGPGPDRVFMGPRGRNFDIEVFEDGEAPMHMGRGFFRSWGGMEMVSLTKELGEYFGTDEGLLVVRGPGEKEMDIQDGDVIKQIDGRTPDSPAHAMRILRSYQAGEKLSIQIVRKKKKMTVEVTLPERKVSGMHRILERELEELHELDVLDELSAPPAPAAPPART